MKKIAKPAALFLAVMLVVLSMNLNASASGAPEITLQPQNLVYPEHASAIYSVEALGNDLSYQWFVVYEGTVYDTADYDSMVSAPWARYAEEGFGPSPDGSGFHFDGILAGLNGAEIYCVVSSNGESVASQAAIIQVGGSALPPEIRVLSEVRVPQGNEGKPLTLGCLAEDPNGGECSYQWYSCSGTLPTIQAMIGEESSELTVPTDQLGKFFYVCMATTPSGGVGYSSVITVSVVEASSSESSSETSSEASSEASEASEESSAESSGTLTTGVNEESSKEKQESSAAESSQESSETVAATESSEESSREESSPESSEESSQESAGQSESSEESSQAAEQSPTQAQNGNQNLILILLCITVVLLIGLIVLLIIMMSRRRKQ